MPNQFTRSFSMAAATAVVLCLAAPRTAAQTLQTGTVSGTVTDAAGKPLSGVQITIVDTNQADLTNAKGFFAINSVLPGTHTVEVSLVGYKSAKDTTVSVTQELTTVSSFQLQREVVDTGSTHVAVPLVNKTRTSAIYTVTSREEQLVRSDPNNLYQYLGAAISQPGVVPNADGFPTIRGSRSSDVGYMLDGILLTNPGNGEFVTNLVTVGMDRMNIYTGGYRADFGGAVGGFINATVKTGAEIRGANVESSTGGWNFDNLVYEQGNVTKGGLNWYVSGIGSRTNFQQNPQYASVPASGDFVAKLVQPVGKKDRLSLLYTGGYSKYNVQSSDPATGDPLGSQHTLEFDDSTNSWVHIPSTQDYLNQGHSIGSLTWAHTITPSSTLSAQAYGWSRQKAVNGESAYDGLWDSRTNEKLGAGKLEYSNQFSEALQLRTGVELIQGNNWDRLARFGDPEQGPPNAYLRLRDADTTDRNAYAAVTAHPMAHLTADLGMRYETRQYHRNISPSELALGNTAILAADQEVLDHTGYNPTYTAVTPRLGLAYALNAKTVLTGSIGRYASFAPSSYIENVYEPISNGEGGGDPNHYPAVNRKEFDVKPEIMNGVDIGVQRQFGSNMALSVTPYWRNIGNLIDKGTVIGYDGQPEAGSAFGNLAHGHTHGVESKLMMREHNGFSGWVTYTYQVAKANTLMDAIGAGFADPDRIDDEFRVNYDQRHTVYLVGNYHHGRYEINPLLEIGSGYPWGNQPGDYVNPDTGVSNGSYGFSPVDGTTPLPILVNGKLQAAGVNPNPFNTGWHKNLSVTFRLFNDKKRENYTFVQVQNILNSKDVTAKFWQNPDTGSSFFGYVPGPVTYTDANGHTQTADGHFEYKTWTKEDPLFVLVGIHRSF